MSQGLGVFVSCGKKNTPTGDHTCVCVTSDWRHCDQSPLLIRQVGLLKVSWSGCFENSRSVLVYPGMCFSFYICICVCVCVGRCAWTWARSQVVWDRKLELWFLYNAEADTRRRRQQQQAEKQRRLVNPYLRLKSECRIRAVRSTLLYVSGNINSNLTNWDLRAFHSFFIYFTDGPLLKAKANAAYWNWSGSRETTVMTGSVF